MKTRSCYLLRQVMDMYVVMGVGSEGYAPNQIMSLNETGAFLWGLLEQGAERADLTAGLLREYDVDTATAERDVDLFLAQLRAQRLLEE